MRALEEAQDREAALRTARIAAEAETERLREENRRLSDELAQRRRQQGG
jgi:hypothetical protein